MTLCWRTWRKIWLYITASSYVLLSSHFHTVSGNVFIWKILSLFLIWTHTYYWCLGFPDADILEKAECDVPHSSGARKQQVEFLCLLEQWVTLLVLIPFSHTLMDPKLQASTVLFIKRPTQSFIFLSRDQKKISWKIDTLFSWGLSLHHNFPDFWPGLLMEHVSGALSNQILLVLVAKGSCCWLRKRT